VASGSTPRPPRRGDRAPVSVSVRHPPPRCIERWLASELCPVYLGLFCVTLRVCRARGRHAPPTPLADLLHREGGGAAGWLVWELDQPGQSLPSPPSTTRSLLPWTHEHAPIAQVNPRPPIG